jgi:hypothetical protein
MGYFSFRFLVLLIPVLLTGCDSAKEFLGLTEKQPDAFEVMERSPLELPPDFSLHPPEPGKKRPQEQHKKDIALQHLMQHTARGSVKRSHYKSSHGQYLLRKKTGADKSTGVIRNKMRTQERNEAEDSFLKQLVTSSHSPSVINPHEEKKKFVTHQP